MIVNSRMYRVVATGDRWQKSHFSYFNERRREWRTVLNWNTKEMLFNYLLKSQQGKLW